MDSLEPGRELQDFRRNTLSQSTLKMEKKISCEILIPISQTA
jgi:hypothetical protein